jgi:hypothetical protein
MCVIEKTLPLALTSDALTPEAAAYLQRLNIGAQRGPWVGWERRGTLAGACAGDVRRAPSP